MLTQLNIPLEVGFVKKTKKGTLIRVPGIINVTESRIEFLKSPFELKDEIKAMKGSRWHGHEDPPRKIWTVENCARNWFSLKILLGENPYEWFDRPIEQYSYERPLMSHQKEMSDACLTYHYQILAAGMGVGKTLSAIEIMEKSKLKNWWWLGPKSGLYAVEREFKKWEISNDLNINILTYDGLVSRIKAWRQDNTIPQGIVFDESSRLKTSTAQRTQAAQYISDCIREKYGYDGYVILMSGTPAPKTPVDWWSQCEICFPGYLKEGHPYAFKLRLGIFEEAQNKLGQTFPQHIAWRDNELKCDICGRFNPDMCNLPEKYQKELEKIGYCKQIKHNFTPSKNEISYLYERLKGLVIIKQLKECVNLPEKRYRIVRCEPTQEMLRVAKTLFKAAPRTITGLIWLRELSDGFQYRNKKTGTQQCPVCKGLGKHEYWIDPNDSERIFEMSDMLDSEYVKTLKKETLDCLTCDGVGEIDKIERTVKEIPTPKDKALIDLLDENEEQGRVVIFGGFTGSIDKITSICLKQKWDVVRVDGRGWIVIDSNENQLNEKPLDYWANLENNRVAFVAHPKSGGMSLTLTEARMAIYYSNSYETESRTQSEDRIHRLGMDMNKGATIVDLVHLPTDEAVLNRLREDRRLELMTMGEIEECLN